MVQGAKKACGKQRGVLESLLLICLHVVLVCSVLRRQGWTGMCFYPSVLLALGGLLGPLHLVAVVLMRQCQTCGCQGGLHVSATLQSYPLFAHGLCFDCWSLSYVVSV